MVDARFWSKVRVGSPQECWPWTAARLNRKLGYGQIFMNGRRQLAHRVAWQLCRGPIPVGMVVAHHCDNPPCCNPAHLFLGTQADNLADMRSKGRAAPFEPIRGEGHPKGRLTELQVREIRRRYASGGVRQVDLAGEFGVSQHVISGIVRGRYWASVA